MMDKRNLIIVVLGVICLVLAWILWSSPVITPSDKIIQEQEARYAAEKKQLLFKIAARDSTNNLLRHMYDSIIGIENKVKIEYLTKYEKIKTLPANDLVREFERVFAENHIE